MIDAFYRQTHAKRHINSLNSYIYFTVPKTFSVSQQHYCVTRRYYSVAKAYIYRKFLGIHHLVTPATSNR